MEISDSCAQRYDLAIVGGGLTGLAAARRASQLGLSTIVVAATPGSLPYTSGALDLLAVHPTETKHYRWRPWEALADLVEERPGHPYGKAGLAGTRRAWDEFAAHLEAGPLGYRRWSDENVLLVTAAGTLKPTYLVPESMAGNVTAWATRAPTVIVGFDRLMELSPEHVVAALADRWPGLRALRVDAVALGLSEVRVTSAVLAEAFDREPFRAAFAAVVAPALQGATHVGLPAVLGHGAVGEVCRDLSARLGAEVFEIPLLSPSLPGLRLVEMLRRDLLESGVTLSLGRPVEEVERSGRRATGLVRAGTYNRQLIEADAILLATGRFFGRGLEATQSGIREPLLGLSVDAPRSRDAWHMETFLGAPGHPINRCGLRTDGELRPVDAAGRPVLDNVYAAGALLEGHDWVREKSGAGTSVVTAYAAVERAAARIGGGR